MIHKKFFSVLFFFGVYAALEAGPLIMFAPGDAIFDDIRFLSTEAGVPPASFTPPLSSGEVQVFLNQLKIETLSPAGMDSYKRVQEKLNPPPLFSNELVSLSVHVIATLEAGVRSNKAVPWLLLESARPSFLSIPLNVHIANTVQFHFDPDFRLFPDYHKNASHFDTSFPYKLSRIDNGFPFRAFAGLGGAWWNFQIGRDRLSFGTAHTGNLFVSDTPDYYDFARVSVFFSRVKYSALVSQMPLIIDNAIVDPAIVNLADYPSIQTETLNRYLYLHRIDIKITGNLSIGLAEGMITGDSPVQLRYLNPFMIMHDFFSGYDAKDWAGNLMDNMGFSFELNWSPVPSVLVYGQLVVDDIVLPIIEEGSEVPNKTGGLAGIEYTRSFKNWAMTVYGELVCADPYLYVDNSPFAALIWWRRMVAHPGGKYRYRWIGHPEGRDMIHAAAGLRLAQAGSLVFNINASFTSHGSHGIVWDDAKGKQYAAERTPTGTPENQFSLAFAAKWKPLMPITLSGGIAGTVVSNSRQSDKSTIFGAEGNFKVQFVW